MLQFGTYSRVLSHLFHANSQVFFQPAQLPFLLRMFLLHFPPLNVCSFDQFLQLTPSFFLVLHPTFQSQNFLLHSTDNTHILLMFSLLQRYLLTFDIPCRLYFLSQICYLFSIALIVLLDQSHLPNILLTLLQQRSMRLKGFGQVVENLLECFLGIVLIRIDYSQQFLVDFPEVGLDKLVILIQLSDHILPGNLSLLSFLLSPPQLPHLKLYFLQLHFQLSLLLRTAR